MASADHFTIAKRYADALFALSIEQKAENAVEKDLRVLADAAESDKNVADFLSTPLLSREAKAKALQALLEKGKAHPLTRQFIARLAQNNRLSLLADVAKAFFRLLADRRGELSVEVDSAKPLSDADSTALANVIGKLYGKKALVASRVEPGLIGGVVIRVGDVRIDYSVAGQLDRLNAQLKATSLPAHA